MGEFGAAHQGPFDDAELFDPEQSAGWLTLVCTECCYCVD